MTTYQQVKEQIGNLINTTGFNYQVLNTLKDTSMQPKDYPQPNKTTNKTNDDVEVGAEVKYKRNGKIFKGKVKDVIDGKVTITTNDGEDIEVEMDDIISNIEEAFVDLMGWNPKRLQNKIKQHLLKIESLEDTNRELIHKYKIEENKFHRKLYEMYIEVNKQGITYKKTQIKALEETLKVGGWHR